MNRQSSPAPPSSFSRDCGRTSASAAAKSGAISPTLVKLPNRENLVSHQEDSRAGNLIDVPVKSVLVFGGASIEDPSIPVCRVVLRGRLRDFLHAAIPV